MGSGDQRIGYSLVTLSRLRNDDVEGDDGVREMMMLNERTAKFRSSDWAGGLIRAAGGQWDCVAEPTR